MSRIVRATALTALCCLGLTGCGVASDVEEGLGEVREDLESAADEVMTDGELFTGSKTLTVDGGSVHVSCSGAPADGRPVIVLMAGMGDGLDTMADLQRTLAEDDRVCSYDRFGEGESDPPSGPQTIADSGETLTAVLDDVSPDAPAVLVGHSLGGLIAARYAPDHPERVGGLVLLDATSPTMLDDITGVIPESATGEGAEVRAQNIAVFEGENPENLVIESDPLVRPAGDVPVEVVRHGVPYLGEIAEYGDELERVWAEGQEKWLELSEQSRLTTASESGHYIHVDQPGVAVETVRSVVERAAG
ncbi:alpha/beta fold hydrolase [Nocardiopsis changdeensis]|uniref:Alpha/beta fold hydrolase n=1 Tax=Nocardiopsis changdeensis TaxID=2831969 RepID=A0ABX8BJY9_9ACTN|nr:MULTISPECIES: alpha/beta hydrolase [Nocardiopsis]QUX21783.1 alpha/beta fold hydrolase [Nocardiopsis changdeensis]QYX37718.1 alpha/beta hydrolase [Nocardiopsis sp. MT53]